MSKPPECYILNASFFFTNFQESLYLGGIVWRHFNRNRLSALNTTKKTSPTTPVL